MGTVSDAALRPNDYELKFQGESSSLFVLPSIAVLYITVIHIAESVPRTGSRPKQS